MDHPRIRRALVKWALLIAALVASLGALCRPVPLIHVVLALVIATAFVFLSHRP